MAMEFITHLPPTRSVTTATTTIVDRFSRPVHSMEAKDMDTAFDTATFVFKENICLYGLPDSTISELDPKTYPFSAQSWCYYAM